MSTDWREIHRDQNLRMAAKMLEQQGKINKLRAELEAARPVVEAAAAYEAAWDRYANPSKYPGLNEEVLWRLDKANAHQAPLNAVRAAAVDLYRSTTPRNLDSAVPDPSLDAETLPTTEEKP